MDISYKEIIMNINYNQIVKIYGHKWQKHFINKTKMTNKSVTCFSMLLIDLQYINNGIFVAVLFLNTATAFANLFNLSMTVSDRISELWKVESDD